MKKTEELEEEAREGKGLNQKSVWCVQGTARRPAGLGSGERE